MPSGCDATRALPSRAAAGEDINAVARSHARNLLAVADEFGALQVFAHPVGTHVRKPRRPRERGRLWRMAADGFPSCRFGTTWRPMVAD
jgi:hypothetical protein